MLYPLGRPGFWPPSPAELVRDRVRRRVHQDCACERARCSEQQTRRCVKLKSSYGSLRARSNSDATSLLS